HPPRHDPHGSGAREEEAQRADAAAGARRACLRGAGERGRQDAAGGAEGDGRGAAPRRVALGADRRRGACGRQLGRGALMPPTALRAVVIGEWMLLALLGLFFLVLALDLPVAIYAQDCWTRPITDGCYPWGGEGPAADAGWHYASKRNYLASGFYE